MCGTKDWPCLSRGNNPWMTCWRDSMVLVLLLDLRYTSSVFSMISGRKCSLDIHLSHARRENDKSLPFNVEPPQCVSKVISGLPNMCSIPCLSKTSHIFHTLRPKSVSSALVLIRVTSTTASANIVGTRTIRRSRMFHPSFRQLA